MFIIRVIYTHIYHLSFMIKIIIKAILIRYSDNIIIMRINYTYAYYS